VSRCWSRYPAQSPPPYPDVIEVEAEARSRTDGGRGEPGNAGKA
jgi:hypothetical protein